MRGHSINYDKAIICQVFGLIHQLPIVVLYDVVNV